MNAQHNSSSDISLNAQQQAIVAISSLTAMGDLTQLKSQLNAGLDAGLTINELKEVLVQLYAYCGFPRSLNGINTLIAVLEERKAKGLNDNAGKTASPLTNNLNKYETGKQTLQKLTGKEENSLSGANAFAPVIDTFLKEHLFADIFNSDVLSYQQRELVTISALSAMTGVEPQLQAHMGMGINTGITKGQLLEIVSLIKKHIGEEYALVAETVLSKLDK